MAVVIVAVSVEERVWGAWLRVPQQDRSKPPTMLPNSSLPRPVTCPRWCDGEIVYALTADQVTQW